jgi:hypothetical protein
VGRSRSRSIGIGIASLLFAGIGQLYKNANYLQQFTHIDRAVDKFLMSGTNFRAVHRRSQDYWLGVHFGGPGISSLQNV